jgi:hypothetical protein
MKSKLPNRLTKQQIAAERARFCGWQTPEEMLDRADALLGRIGSAVDMNQAGLRFRHEANVAGRFAMCFANRSAVRLVDASVPDFEMRTATGQIASFEITEADTPGRKRGLEYRHIPHPAPIILEDVDQDEDEKHCLEVGPLALRLACEKKSDGRYDPDTYLAINFNVPVCWLDRRRAIAKQIFLNGTETARDHFRGVFVVWATEVYWMWCKGASRYSMLRPIKAKVAPSCRLQ